MKRFTNGVEAFYCSPEHGCRDKGCPGVERGSPRWHGQGTDEWYFTVACEHGRALTLSVFGVQQHPAAKAAGLGLAMEEPRGLGLAGCRLAGPAEEGDHEGGGAVTHECEHLDGQLAVRNGTRALASDYVWRYLGQGTPDTQQPESFWAGLEAIHRAECPRCELAPEEEALVEAALAPKGRWGSLHG